MPRRIVISNRVVQHIAVAVQVLRVPRARHDAVGRQEAADARAVEARYPVAGLPSALALSGFIVIAMKETGTPLLVISGPTHARQNHGFVARIRSDPLVRRRL